jgi:hypothetical protein
MIALRRANEVRSARAKLKQELRENKVPLSGSLPDTGPRERLVQEAGPA